MGRSLRAAILVGVTCASYVAIAWAQTAAAPATASGSDPLNALWSFLGTSPVALVLYQWAKAEQSDRREAVNRMLSMFETDADHKATLRERLKGQDDLIAKVLEAIQRVERKQERP
jgi:hypothetical protein